MQSAPRFLNVPNSWKCLLVASTLCATIATLSYRLSIGVDLSDEAYYATFLDGWLKLGLSNQQNLSIHQTSELLMLPFAVLYKMIQGSEDGIILYFRYIYLILSILCSFCVYLFISQLQGRLVGVLSAGFVLFFIPFGLPAPSYNTIGMFASIAGTCLFAQAVLNGNGPKSDTGQWQKFPMVLLAAGFAWMLAIIAYPTLLAALVGLHVSALYFLRHSPSRRVVLQSMLICGAFQLLGLSILLLMLGPRHILRMFEFTDAVAHVTDGLPGKINTELGRLSHNMWYALLCIFSVGFAVLPGTLSGGSCDKWWRASAIPIAFGLLWILKQQDPVLYVPSHDLVLLFALFGFYLILRNNVRDDEVPTPNLLRAIFLSSFVGGLITAATATNGLLNFAIGGGLFSACLALTFLVPQSRQELGSPLQLGHLAVLLSGVGIIGIESWNAVYGEIGNPLDGPSVRIGTGAFAGLLTTPDKAEYVRDVTRVLAEEQHAARSITVIGLPGIYLLTPLSPRAPTAWTALRWRPGAEQLLRDFYAVPANQPDIIVRYTGAAWRGLLPPIEPMLPSGYVKVAEMMRGDWAFELSRREPLPFADGS